MSAVTRVLNGVNKLLGNVNTYLSGKLSAKERQDLTPNHLRGADRDDDLGVSKPTKALRTIHTFMHNEALWALQVAEEITYPRRYADNLTVHPIPLCPKCEFPLVERDDETWGVVVSWTCFNANCNHEILTEKRITDLHFEVQILASAILHEPPSP